MEENNKKNIGVIIFRIISVIIIIICLIVLFLWQKDNTSNAELQNDLSSLISIKDSDDQEIIEDLGNSNNNDENSETTVTSDLNNFDVDFNSLLEKNSETVGWIKIDNTNINYPIVQSKDNSYYLTKNFNKKKIKLVGFSLTLETILKL